MSSTQDVDYCHEVAKRSVARAALHLGIDFVSEEALDTLGDVLLTYLERFGRNLSATVESSGRSSAHVNVLDAFAANRACSAPTVMQLHQQVNDEDTASSVSRRSLPQQGGWQELAEFCFGPDWSKAPDKQGANQNAEPEAQQLGQGKKMMPDRTNHEAAKKAKKAGWNAPYMDEVPPFPVASPKCANPHRLPNTVVQSLHGGTAQKEGDGEENLAKQAEEEAARELESLSDDLFTTPWGEVGAKTATPKRPLEEAPGDEADGPPTKRARIQEEEEEKDAEEKPAEAKDKQEKVPLELSSAKKRPKYVPSFLPPFPQDDKSARLGRTVVEIDDKQAAAMPSVKKKGQVKMDDDDDSSLLQVRSSLVKLGSHYWGSGWNDDSSANNLQVPMKRVQSEAEAPVVVPLLRASGSRVSRILEGSMEQFQ